jgi:hypothetical protein
VSGEGREELLEIAALAVRAGWLPRAEDERLELLLAGVAAVFVKRHGVRISRPCA